MRKSSIAAIAMLLLARAASAATAAAPAQFWAQSFELSPAAFRLPDSLPKQFEQLRHPPTLKGTLRYRFALSIGGHALRVQLSNALDDKPLRVAGASVALVARGLFAQPATLRRLSFGGQRSVDIPANAPVLSDIVDLEVPALAELVVSVQVPDGIRGDGNGGATMLQVDGDAVMQSALPNARAVEGRPIVSGVLVARDRPTGVLVVLGDSTSDGSRSNPAAARGWVDALTRRLAARPGGLTIGVVTAGINGNRVLSGGMGASALARADGDVFAVPGLRHLIVLQGINDIGMSGKNPFTPDAAPLSAGQLTAGLAQLAARAQARGVKIYAGTIMPFRGALHFGVEKEQLRLAVNAWIRTSMVFDGFIDFDQALRDTVQPDALDRAYDSGDHLHPSDAGYRAMAEAVPLRLFD